MWWTCTIHSMGTIVRFDSEDPCTPISGVGVAEKTKWSDALGSRVEFGRVNSHPRFAIR